jgi:hypothetical protein
MIPRPPIKFLNPSKKDLKLYAKENIKEILSKYPELLNELIIEQRQNKLTKIINKI